MYKELYKELDKDLKDISQKKKISDYSKRSESWSCIDEFYSKNTLSSSFLYKRQMSLKEKSEKFKVISLPTYMSIVFGVLVTVGIYMISTLFDDSKKFFVESKEMVEKSLGTLPFENIQEANNIIIVTLLKMASYICLILMLLIVVAILLIYVFNLLHQRDNFKLVAYEYEISKIQHLLDGLEKKGIVKTNTVLRLENSEHLLEYTLTKVTKK